MPKKLTVKELNERVESNYKSLTKECKRLEASISKLSSKMSNLQATVTHILGKHTSQIRVLEGDGSWGDYTGIFYCDREDNKDTVESKAMNHYKHYFEGEPFYRNKTLALFISNDKGKKLVQILQDPEQRLVHYPNLKKQTIDSLKEYFKNGGQNVNVR